MSIKRAVWVCMLICMLALAFFLVGWHSGEGTRARSDGLDSGARAGENKHAVGAVAHAAESAWDSAAQALAGMIAAPPLGLGGEGDASFGAGRTIRPSDSADDAEWKTFPRSRWRFAATFLATPQGIEAKALYRHVELNPRDAVIPSTRRQEFAEWFASLRPALNGGLEAIGRSTQEELLSLIDSGAIQPLELRDDPETRKDIERRLTREKESRKKWAERGVPYVEPVLGKNWIPPTKAAYVGGEMVQAWQQRGVEFYGARREQMPTTGRLWAERDLMVSQLACSVVTWFASEGALSRVEAEMLMKGAFEAVDDPRVPR